MPLGEEIDSARHEIVTDGYEMSIGELMNLRWWSANSVGTAFPFRSSHCRA